METHQFHAMNTTIVLEAEGAAVSSAFELAQRYIERAEKRFSRFLPESELSALNRSAGAWFDASPEMMDVLDHAVSCHLATQKLFDPCILPELQAVGYSQSMGQVPDLLDSDQTCVHARRGSSSFDEIEIDWITGRVRLPAEMKIDLGGIAKGWIAEQAANLMTKFSSACAVSAGGDIFLFGLPDGKDVWDVTLEDPRDPQRDLLVLLVEDGAVATSSVAKRTWMQAGEKRHHLINPRTGKPAQTPWLSVTAFAPSGVLAETFAKALLIGGPVLSERLLEEHPEVSFIAVDIDGQLWTSPTEKENIYA